MATYMRVILYFQTLLQLFSLINISSGDKVPVFIWGKNSQPDLLPSSSALGSLSSNDFSEKYVKYFVEAGKLPFVVFAQDSLSLEDVNRKPSSYPNLESNLENEPSIFLSSVNDPIKAIESFKPQIIRSSDLNTKSLEKILKEKPQVLLVLLPTTIDSADRKNVLLKNDKVMEDISALFGTSFNKMFTGKSSSWDLNVERESHHRVARQLQESLGEIQENATAGFRNFSGNLYWYSKGITIQSNHSDYNGDYNPPTDIEHNNVTNSSMDIDLKLTKGNDTSKLITVVLHLDIERIPGHWWYVRSSYLQMGNEDAIPMAMTHVGASDGFSYSCGKGVIKVDNTSLPESDTTMIIKNFQLEFLPRSSRFAESFHCTTYFTIPLWMGFFVVLLFTIILAMGVYLLFEVKNMDRFDDPKGKTISVPQVD